MFNAQQFENMEGNKLTDFFKPTAKTKTTEDAAAGPELQIQPKTFSG